MNFTINWELYMDVTSPDKAKRFIEKLSDIAEIGFELDGLERYNKGKINYRASLKSTAEASTLADAMWSTVKKANNIAKTWAITGNDLNDFEFGEVIGTALPKTIKVQGVESMEFRIAIGVSQSDGSVPKALAM